MGIIDIQRFIDKNAGSLLCTLLAIPRKSTNKPSQPQRILIIKLWAIGESITTLPMIKALRAQYPNAIIDVLTRTRNKAVYKYQYSINKVRNLSLATILNKRNTYDLVIDCEPFLNISAIIATMLGRHVIGFSHGARAKLYDTKVDYNDRQHVVQTYMDLLKPLNIDHKPTKLQQLNHTKRDFIAIEKLLQKHTFRKEDIIIGFGSGAAESARTRIWHPKRFAKLADILITKYRAKIVLIGSPNEQRINNFIRKNVKQNEHIIDLTGKTSIPELFYLMKKFTLFISNDSGPMHIAAAQGVKTIGLFGPNTPTRFSPFGPGNTFIYKPTQELPCINVHKGEIPNCHQHKHMSQITIEDVHTKIQELLQ